MKKNRLAKRVCRIALTAAVFYFFVLSAWPTSSRIKDIAAFEGVRDNQLIGYGLVVGLDGTGDSRQTRFTTQTLSNLLNLQGIVVPAQSIQIKNTAAAMVTANLPPFARKGARIDVTVSSIGDAASLQGGVLLFTSLRGPNHQVYANAQGPVSIGGFSVRSSTSSVQKNQPTAGRVPNGAIVEREVNFSLQGKNTLTLLLHEGDFTTANRLASLINRSMNSNLAIPLDNRAVQIRVPDIYRLNVVEFITQIENESLEIDRVARVVLNEKTGTIIFGKEVKIAPVTIVHGSLTVQVGTEFAISQPGAFSSGETAVVPNQTVEVGEQLADSVTIPEGATIEEIIRGLNAIGATPRDVLAIIQAIKASGALQSEVEII
jgi:flagellar P-ring protein precursor FlgI